MKVEVKEVKAPTDESLKLLKEYQEKVKRDLVSQIHLSDDNELVKGEIFAFGTDGIAQSTRNVFEVFFKFSINEKEFIIKKEYNLIYDILDENSDVNKIHKLNNSLRDTFKSVVIYTLLNNFIPIAFESILGKPMPDYLLKNFIIEK